MEQLTRAGRACAVAAAAAHDFNNELTVILSGVASALHTTPADDPARRLLLEVQAAAQRCVWKASGLLAYSVRVNPRPIHASFEYLIDQ